jgi:hypothetical protein
MVRFAVRYWLFAIRYSLPFSVVADSHSNMLERLSGATFQVVANSHSNTSLLAIRCRRKLVGDFKGALAQTRLQFRPVRFVENTAHRIGFV